ncbi:MAG: nucleoside triphosphate pyrophosphohydrolase [Candidatus Babeliaceae bacterium]|jgi:predicted house-cleaning noncanonical NTP pyrophosphatase (MazG superfamily)
MIPKLVRNFIPKIIESQGQVPVYYQADDEEYWEKLMEKLIEEVHEFINSENNIEEIADILEVLDAIMLFKNISRDAVNQIKNKKAQSNGTFSDKIILSSIKDS